MKNYLVGFAIAFVAFAALFLAIDITIMQTQGLSLIYQP